MNITNKLKKAFAERKAMRELAALDDYVLRDIGVQRSDIRNAVRTGR